MSDQALEQKLQERGLNAPRLNPDHIAGKVVGEAYHHFPGTAQTVCCLTLENGFTVVGESAAASLANFDAEIGREIAFKNAVEKVWMLEGYLLKQRLYDQERFRGEATDV